MFHFFLNRFECAEENRENTSTIESAIQCDVSDYELNEWEGDKKNMKRSNLEARVDFYLSNNKIL